jgi:hypothetical protein
MVCWVLIESKNKSVLIMAYPDPWSTPVQPLSSPLYAGSSSGANAFADANMRQQLERLIQEGKVKIGKAGEVLLSGAEAAGTAIGKVPKRAVVGGGAVLAGVPALLQGDIAGAAGTTVGGLIGGGIGAAIGGPAAPFTAAAGTAIGSMIGGGIVGGTKAALEKNPQAVSIPTPFGDLPLNASAQQLKYMQQLGELGETQQRNALQTRIGGTIDLLQKINAEDLKQRQAMYPMVQKEQNDDLARAQALINTQNNAYMQQMVLGGGINLTLDAQRERGAFMRQAIATNPYVTALAAPNVSIG